MTSTSTDQVTNPAAVGSGAVWAPIVGLAITVAGFITLAFLGVDIGVYTAYAATITAAGAGAVATRAVASRRTPVPEQFTPRASGPVPTQNGQAQVERI